MLVHEAAISLYSHTLSNSWSDLFMMTKDKGNLFSSWTSLLPTLPSCSNQKGFSGFVRLLSSCSVFSATSTCVITLIP